MKGVNEKIYRRERNLLQDSRGWFLKVIDGNEKENPFPCEVYITSAKPGQGKGGHYHNKAREWFTLIRGKALLSIINITTQERSEFLLDGSNPETIYVPPGIAHNFQNAGDEDFVLVAFSDVQYDPSDTILYNFDSTPINNH